MEMSGWSHAAATRIQIIFDNVFFMCGPGSSVGITTDYGPDGPGIEYRWDEILRTCPDWPWGPPSLLYDGYRVFSRGKVQFGRAADRSPPSNAAVKEE
jgi:hypothetical protein